MCENAQAKLYEEKLLKFKICWANKAKKKINIFLRAPRSYIEMIKLNLLLEISPRQYPPAASLPLNLSSFYFRLGHRDLNPVKFQESSKFSAIFILRTLRS